MVYNYFILFEKVVTIEKKVQKIVFSSFEKMITNDNKKMQKVAKIIYNFNLLSLYIIKYFKYFYFFIYIFIK